MPATLQKSSGDSHELVAGFPYVQLSGYTGLLTGISIMGPDSIAEGALYNGNGPCLMRFVFFTKTDWSEPPRLRHQLAHLLAEAGHEVVFFEKPLFLWQRQSPKNSSSHPVELVRTRQFIHHKLRLNPILHAINAAWEKYEISRSIQALGIKNGDIVVNFNYDYYFIRTLFPQSKVITIINDNFWSRSIGGWNAPLKYALKRTCLCSDAVLTVSPSLQRELSVFCDPQIFYPWADIGYTEPNPVSYRNTLLYWGYVGERIDYHYVRGLADRMRDSQSEYRIVFVGPVQDTKNAKGSFRILKDHSHICFLPASSLDELDLSQVLAAFIPYLSDNEEINAIVLPNKGLQLLARGLPLVISGMPEFIQEPFVFRLTGDSGSDMLLFERIRAQFPQLQPGIQRFVESNTAKHRLDQFMAILD